MNRPGRSASNNSNQSTGKSSRVTSIIRLFRRQSAPSGSLFSSHSSSELSPSNNLPTASEKAASRFSTSFTPSLGTFRSPSQSAAQSRSVSRSAPEELIRQLNSPRLALTSSSDKPWTKRHDGGINSQYNNIRGDDIYYIGVIDILQRYNINKRVETIFKSIQYDSNEISSVNAKMYATRFVTFIREHSD